MFVLSVDDKAVTAATKQSPLVMHVSYEICLPDHNFVKATKHKLTPSVYAPWGGGGGGERHLRHLRGGGGEWFKTKSDKGGGGGVKNV